MKIEESKTKLMLPGFLVENNPNSMPHEIYGAPVFKWKSSRNQDIEQT